MVKRMKKGVPKGYKHRWKYLMERWNEIKRGKGRWDFTFFQTKKRMTPAKAEGLPIGSCGS